jgi:hypothetical protein
MTTKIGYIGLGHAGYPMAANLARSPSFSLLVHDADPSRAEKFAKEFPKTAKVAGIGRDAFSDVDVLVTMLPNGEVVRDVLLGEGQEEGVGRGLKRGMIATFQHNGKEGADLRVRRDLRRWGDQMEFQLTILNIRNCCGRYEFFVPVSHTLARRPPSKTQQQHSTRRFTNHSNPSPRDRQRRRHYDGRFGLARRNRESDASSESHEQVCLRDG